MWRGSRGSYQIVKKKMLGFMFDGIIDPRNCLRVEDNFTVQKRLFFQIAMITRVDRIESICTVHNFKRFTIYDAVKNDDFFCRFEYNSSAGAFRPDKVPVYCNCQMPYNPDDIMVHCEGCDDWFHPKCLEMDIKEAQKIQHFFCEVCTSEKQKFLQNSHGTSTPSDNKRAFMAKSRPPRKTLDSYLVKGINKIIRPDDCVLMTPTKSSDLPHVARIEKIVSDSKEVNIRVYVRWYYRPEESLGGRRQFHGSKEIFLSDHYNYQSAARIEGICTVRNYKNFTILNAVGNDDFFCRFKYNSSSGALSPDKVAVYCSCEMPYNPDDIMVHCKGCDDWFHPKCIEMDIEEAQKIKHFFCEVCTSGKQKFL